MRRLYLRSKKLDMMSTIQRSYFDADNGRVKLAVDRLNDLENEIGKDAHISYARGMLYRDSLGMGLNAYQCFTEAMNLDPQHTFSAFNAAKYAPDEANFHRCVEISNRLAPQDAQAFQETTQTLRQGHSYHEVLVGQIQALASQGNEPGQEASLIELALLSVEQGSEEEMSLRKRRAQLMRLLDLAEGQHRETIAEDYPPEERLALKEGLAELEQLLVLNEWDAEIWNFKSAWSILMQNYPLAIASADHAIELHPNGYCRPYHNKATALFQLEKKDEALVCLKEALHQAEISNQLEEINRLRPLVNEMQNTAQNDPAALNLSVIQPLLARIITAARLTAQKELEETLQAEIKMMKFTGNVFELAAAAFRQRIQNFPPDPKDATPYVPAMAQVLSYMGPEACLNMLNIIITKEGELVYENCMLATLYIAAHAEPIMQRDALRFLVLTILVPGLRPGYEESIRDTYRKSILQVSAAVKDEMGNLDQLMRAEMAKIVPNLPKLIADQKPIAMHEVERANQKILNKLQNEIFINNAENFTLPGQPPTSVKISKPGEYSQDDKNRLKVTQIGCGATIVILLGFLVLKYFNIIPWDWSIVIPVGIIGSFFLGRELARIIFNNLPQ